MKYTDYNNKTYNYEARIYSNQYGEYAHIYMDFYFINDNGEKTFSHDLSDFQVSCQMDRESLQHDNNQIYAIEFEYKNHVNANDFKNVNKFLNMIRKGLDNHSEKYGYLNGFGEYLAVICNIIGIKKININSNYWKPGDLKDCINYFIQGKKENWSKNL